MNSGSNGNEGVLLTFQDWSHAIRNSSVSYSDHPFLVEGYSTVGATVNIFFSPTDWTYKNLINH